MKKVLVLSKSRIANDSRVSRQIAYLKKYFDLVVVGYSVSDLKGVECIDLSCCCTPLVKGTTPIAKVLYIIRSYGYISGIIISVIKLLNRIPFRGFFYYVLRVYFLDNNIIRLIKGINCDVIIGNDLSSIIPIINGRRDRKLVYDAHEYSPDQFPNTVAGRLRNARAKYILKKNLFSMDKVYTVSASIASRYSKEFNIECPEVILNTPFYHDIIPNYSNSDEIRLVHHGIAAPIRHLESYVEMMKWLDDRYCLYFYLVNNNEYLGQLKAMAEKYSNVMFMEPVPSNDIVSEINKYDLGLAMFPPSTYNLRHSMPNKLFEYTQARLGVVVGPDCDMSSFVKSNGNGIVVPGYDPESMATTLLKITRSDINAMKNRSHQLALEYSADKQLLKLKNYILQI